MRSKRTDRLVLLTIFLGQAAIGEDYTRDSFKDIRWLGRGNTGVAVVSDASSVFYNPGGLAFNDSFQFPLFNPYMGANSNFQASFATISTLSGGTGTLSEKFAPLLGKPLSLQAGMIPNITIPGFAMGYYGYADAQFEYRNPVYPQLLLNVRYEHGPFVGFAINYMKMIGVGMSIRYVRRNSIEDTITPDTMLAMSGNYFSQINRVGEGFPINLGIQTRYEYSQFAKLYAGLTVEDFGYTNFRNPDKGKPPSRQTQMINFGSAYGLKFLLTENKFLFDVRQLTNDSISFTKKIYVGFESQIPFFDVRVGLYQGNWTAGVTASIIPFIDLEAVSYGEELDSAAGIRTNRFYLLGLKTSLEFKGGAGGAKRKKYCYNLDDFK